MVPLRDRDCTDFNHAVSPELQADLGLVLDLALRSPRAVEIVPVMQRVARAVAAEHLQPEEMIVCVKRLWMDRLDSPGAILTSYDTWLALVRTMVEAYYLAVAAPPATTESGEPSHP